MNAKDQFYFTRKILSAVARWKSAIESAKSLAGTKSLKRERAYETLNQTCLDSPLSGKYCNGTLTLNGTCQIVINSLGGNGFSERLIARF